MEESDGFKYLILVNEEWYITTSKDKGEQLHSGLQDEENLKYSLADHRFERYLEEQLKNEKYPWRTTMRNSGNKRMIKQKEREVEDTRWNLVMI